MFFLAFATAFIAAFTQTMAVLVDKVIVCVFYGEKEIASVALASPFFYMLEIPAAGLAAGIQAVCAKHLGAGQIGRVNRLFNQIFFLAAIVLTVLTALSFVSVPQMAVLFGARGRTAALHPYALQYLFGLSFEILPYVLFCIATPVVILDNGGRLISIASACGCVTDIVLDLLSVKFGWGLTGIGMATSASAVVYFLGIMLHFLKRERVIRLRPVRIRLTELKEMFVCAAPKAFLSLADVLRSAVFITLASVTGGVAGTCVLSIHETIAYTLTIFSTGIAGAVGVLAGICFGEKNRDELEGVGALAHRYGLILSAGVVVIMAVFVRPLSAALTESRETASLLAFALCTATVMFPFSILVHARISYLQAVGQVKTAQMAAVAVNLIFPVAGAALLSIPFGVKGVFIALPLSQIMSLFVSWVKHSRQTGKTCPAGADYLEVDESFDLKPGDVISYPIKTMEDCALASEQVGMFCRGHKLDERKSLFAGLCTEELTTNVLEKRSERPLAIKTADIRIVIDAGDVVIRVRDGGDSFNLKRFSDRLDGQDHTQAGISRRILLTSAKSVSYYKTYGMNTTIMRI